MRSWSLKEAKVVIDWARVPAAERSPLREVAARVGRTVGAVREFARRVLAQQEWPWIPRPRWGKEEVELLQSSGTVESRSREAMQKYFERHRPPGEEALEEDEDKCPLAASEVARDLGISRASVYRLLKAGVLRRFKGGIAKTSFEALIRDHPEVIPYHTLSRDHREWLVLMGYYDPTMVVKRPTTQGWLKQDPTDGRKKRAS